MSGFGSRLLLWKPLRLNRANGRLILRLPFIVPVVYFPHTLQ